MPLGRKLFTVLVAAVLTTAGLSSADAAAAAPASHAVVTKSHKASTKVSSSSSAAQQYSVVPESSFEPAAAHTASVHANDDAAPGTISGTVKGSDTGQGVGNVYVEVDLDNNDIEDTYTDSNGNYSFDDLQPGKYTLYFSTFDDGSYIPQWYNNRGFVTVTSDAVSIANVTLAAAATISGTVVNASNQPVGDIDVTAYDAAGQDIEDQWTEETDEDSPGTYSFTDLPSGSYTLEFQNEGEGSYLNQWWSGQTSEANAGVIVATAGQVSTANATLAAGGIITATVTGADTQAGLDDVIVTAQLVGDPSKSYSSDSDEADNGDDGEGVNGVYTVNNLPTGSYDVHVSAYGTKYLSTYYNGTATISSATPVAVTAGSSPATISQQLVVGGTISGEVHGADGVTIIHGYVSVYDSTGALVGTTGLVAGVNGAYSVSGLATGQYRLDVEYTGVANYLSTWWSGANTKKTATVINVTDGATTTVSPLLRIGGIITGTVTDATTNAPIAGITVASPEAIASVTTDSSGNYSLPGLDTGDAEVEFTDPTTAHAYQYYNNASLQSNETPVAVTAGQTTAGINAALAAAGSISGTVTPTGSGIGIANVEVDAYDADDSFVSSQFTDHSGDYTIGNLPAGSYTLEFNAPSGYDFNGDGEGGAGYAYQWYNGAVLRSHSQPVTVTTGHETDGINASLVPSVDVSGKVSDAATGNGLNTIDVSVTDADGAQVASAGTYDNNDGTYSISGLAAGSYTLQFTDGSTATSAHAYQWWNDKELKSQANTVVVGSSGSSDVTANAALKAGGSIAGTIANLPIDSTIEMTLYDSEQDAVGWGESDPTTPAFSIVGLPAGKYTLRLHDDGGNFPDQWFGGGADSGTQITVTAGNTTTVNPTLTNTVITSVVPTISGTAAFGQTLTEHPGTWGPSPVTLTEQWLRDGSPISGATSTTYAVTAADVGHQLSVTVTGKKTGYPTVTQTSALTSSVIGATLSGATPTVSGNDAVGQVLTAAPGTWGPVPVALSYQWNDSVSGPISGATSSTYTPVAGNQGDTLTVTVTGTKSGYTTLALTSAATSTIGAAFTTLTAGTPTISGTPTYGQTVVAGTGTWSPTPDSFSYQWKRSGTSISGATKSTYKLASADEGHAITVTVTGAKSGFISASATSASITVGKAITKSPTPKISGSALVGSKLTASAGTWSPSSVVKHYQWNRDGTAIDGATKSTYTVVSLDGGATITVTVTGTKTGYTSISKTSAIVTIPLQLTATSQPQITGTVLVGQELTAVPGDWEPVGVTLTFQWKRSGTSISHATGDTYTLTSSDAGKAITVTVTGVLTGYQTVSETSASVTPPKLLTASPVPKISGTGVVGSALTASAGTWSPSTVTLSYQWNLNGSPIDGATSSKYTPVALDAGGTITVTVTGSKTGYASISRTSATGKIITAAP